MDFDSLPPLCVETPTANAERALAREVYEYSAILSVISGDKDDFQKYLSALRPYYMGFQPEVYSLQNFHAVFRALS